jgi:hypothetical protein
MAREDTFTPREEPGYFQVFEEAHVWRRVLTIDSPEGRPILAIEREVPQPEKVENSTASWPKNLDVQIVVRRNMPVNAPQEYNNDILEELCW